MKSFLVLLLVLANVQTYAATMSGKYELKSSKIDYLVKYLFKKADGESVSSKGKGECKESCDFLVAAPIKSFESKDSNRDINMLKVTKAEQFPLVVAKIKTNNEIKNGELIADLEIEFSGMKKSYSKIVFKTNETADGFHSEGRFDLILDDFKIEKPSLLGVDIESIVPMTIVADWKKI